MPDTARASLPLVDLLYAERQQVFAVLDAGPKRQRILLPLL